MAGLDPIALAQALIRRRSVTPADDGALGVIEAALAPLGFRCQRLPFAADGTDDVDNLYARWGDGAPHFCFAGHSDVVPVGDAKGWTTDPFGAELRDGQLWGRGAADMKGAIAAPKGSTVQPLRSPTGTTSLWPAKQKCGRPIPQRA